MGGDLLLDARGAGRGPLMHPLAERLFHVVVFAAFVALFAYAIAGFVGMD